MKKLRVDETQLSHLQVIPTSAMSLPEDSYTPTTKASNKESHNYSNLLHTQKQDIKTMQVHVTIDTGREGGTQATYMYPEGPSIYQPSDGTWILYLKLLPLRLKCASSAYIVCVRRPTVTRDHGARAGRGTDIDQSYTALVYI